MNWRARRQRFVAAVLLAFGLLCAPGASAATVILVPPAAPSAAMAEALVRVRGELVSEGFAVEVVDTPTGGDARGLREGLQSRTGVDAVVAIVEDSVPDAVEIRIVDPRTRQLVVRRMSFQPASKVTAKTLAIHTLELIRATFLELDLMPAPRQATPRPPQLPTVGPIEADTPPREPGRVSVDVGATARFELAGGLPTLLPIVQVSWALRPWLLPQLAAAGFGTRRTITSNGARAQMSQQFALVGAAYRFRAAMRLRPFLSLSGGVLHTSAQGQAASPDFGREAEQWSFLLDGGAGAWMALGGRFQVALAVRAQLAEPYPTVRFADSAVKPSTRPSLVATLTVGSWL